MTKPTVTNDKPPVAPVEGHYAMLRNGEVCGPINLSLFDKDFYFEIKGEIFNWNQDGTANWMGEDYDIIATISPEAMAWAANPQCDYGFKSVQALILRADAACDYADSHCRAFPIATAPTDRDVSFWDSSLDEWQEFTMIDISLLPPSYTHWRESFPPPSNPPLPAVFVELGAAMEKIKGAG